MAPQILIDVVLPNGVVLDASIFDDRNYVEIDERYLAEAQKAMSRQTRSEREPSHLIVELN
jgi:hypothetical protein